MALLTILGDPDAMFQLSTTLISEAEAQAATLAAGAAALTPPVINPSFPTIASAPVPITTPLPTFIPVTWSTPAQPAPFNGTLSIGNYLPGAFNGAAPSLSFGVPPSGFTGAIPPSPSLNLSFTYPTVSVTLPTPPQLLSISTITFTPLAIPTFNVNVPTLSLAAPNAVSYVEGAFYTSSELSTVQTSLISAMTNGTDTGLDNVTQNSLWNAAYEREYRSQADALASLARDQEELGYAFPPGSFIDARLKVYTETQYTIAGLSREIMVKQAQLHLDNVMKSRELAISLEGKLIEYYNQINQRSFENAKYQTESAVAIYNAQVQAFTARLEGYKTQALVYETQIKGIQAYVDQLKAQIEFERTKAEIDRALVEVYKTEVDAALANLEVFKTQVEIIKTQAEVEKIKVEAYGAQIQAFVGTVNAYTAQVEGYKAGVEAQGVIESVYKTQVDVYAAEVQAGVAVINAEVASYRAQIEAYTAQIEGYKAALQAQVSQAQSANLYNTALVEEFRGEVQAVTSYNTVLTEQWKAVVDTNERIVEVAVKAAEANGQLLISTRNLQMEATKVAATVSAQLGAAALNAIHWSSSSSYSDSESTSTSMSTSTSKVTSSSTSQSTSTSTSTNYNYNASV